MFITDIKNTDPLKAFGSSLNFSDEKATSDEIIQFINAVPVEINSLYFSNGSIVPANFGRLRKLKQLHIESKRQQLISDEIWKIPVITLTLRGCSQENLSLHILQNVELQSLSIEGDFSKLPEGKYDLPQLKRLRLASENLDYIPDNNHHFPLLNFLTITNCTLKNIPKAFLSGGKMIELALYSSDLQDLPDVLSGCQDLNILTLDAPLTKGIPNLSSTKLKYITLNNLCGKDYDSCQFPKSTGWTRIHPKTRLNIFPDLSECSEITSIILSNGDSYPKLPQDLRRLKDVLFSNMLGAELPSLLSTAINLRTIHLRTCPIERFPTFLADFTSLHEVSLHGTKIKSIPENWKSCDTLENLTINSDNLSIPSLSFIQNFKKLKTLNISETYRSQSLSMTTVLNSKGGTPKRQPLLIDKYSLIGKKRIPLRANNNLLRDCRFRPVNYKGGARNKSLKPQTFLDFCAALGNGKLSETDRKYFFDLLWNVPTVQNLPVLDFPTFLKALNINFKPLSQMLQRRLVREVLLQHFLKLKLVKSPKAFESHDAEKFLLQPDSKPMLDNVQVFLRNDRSQNVLLGLQMLKTGGVPVDLAEELLLLAKTHPFPEVRTEARDLLQEIIPEEWKELLDNKLIFHHEPDEIKQGFWENQLTKLSKSIKPKLAAFSGF